MAPLARLRLTNSRSSSHHEVQPAPVRADELARRRTAWTPPAPRYTGGVLAKYAALVSSASEGAVTTGARMTLALRGSSARGEGPLDTDSRRDS